MQGQYKYKYAIYPPFGCIKSFKFLGVCVAQMVVLKESEKSSKLSERERLLLLEVGRDEIYSASMFVDYFSEEYSMAKSTVWYNLHKLKAKEILDFASKEEVGKSMKLTKKGLSELMRLRSTPVVMQVAYADAGSRRHNALSRLGYYTQVMGNSYAYLGQK
jgi:DNA-binding PadR family transcriptional regulator